MVEEDGSAESMMSSSIESDRAPLKWQLAIAATFALGMVVGLGLLGLRFLFRGDPDPLTDGWPLHLQAGALAGALAVTLLFRRPVAAALGLFCGLVAHVLGTGASEYPMSSCIALAVHALVPASAGALIGFFVAARTRGNQP
jgi:hypothetical protein